jgi:hypothetical protein
MVVGVFLTLWAWKAFEHGATYWGILLSVFACDSTERPEPSENHDDADSGDRAQHSRVFLLWERLQDQPHAPVQGLLFCAAQNNPPPQENTDRKR